jgi:hypothetical protein
MQGMRDHKDNTQEGKPFKLDPNSTKEGDMFQKYLHKLIFHTMLLASLFLSVGVVSADPYLDPPTVDVLIYPGESAQIDKTVTTPEIAPNPDIYFLADTTGSMGSVISQVKADASTLLANIAAQTTEPRFGAGSYKDFPLDIYAFNNGASIPATDDGGASALAAIAGWSAGGGYDGSEAQFYALDQIAEGVVNWRTDSVKIVVWFGDAPGHDPICSGISGLAYDITEASLITKLVAAEIRVIAIGTTTGYPNALNDNPTYDANDYLSKCTIGGSPGQADRIAAATGGVSLQDVSPEDITDAILEGLENLPADVAMQSDCADPISTTFDPDVQTVSSGEDAFFLEEIAVAADAAGGTYTCSDWATINDTDMVDDLGNLVTEEKTIYVPGIGLLPVTAINELGVDLSHTVQATVIAGDFGPVEGVRVAFEVSGQNAGFTGEGLTDATGQVDFTYEPPVEPDSLGSDIINACFTDSTGETVYGCVDATKDWVDTTPPDSFCTPSVNPSGKEPQAPAKGDQGQNQDGFYEISAEDVVWPGDALQIFVTDSGSGTVFGPFPTGTVIKYVEDLDAIPEMHPMGGNNSSGNGNALEVDWFIKGTGDAFVTAVDGSGNVSGIDACLVPPPPK